MVFLTLNSLVLINFVKKNSPSGGPLPGVTLGGEQPPAARCAGAKMRNLGLVFDVIQSHILIKKPKHWYPHQLIKINDWYQP